MAMLGTRPLNLLAGNSLPLGHPLRRRDIDWRKIKSGDWKQLFGVPDGFNPTRLPLAPSSLDVTDEEVRAIEAAELKAASEASSSSDFWEDKKGSLTSQSSNESTQGCAMSTSLGKTTEATEPSTHAHTSTALAGPDSLVKFDVANQLDDRSPSELKSLLTANQSEFEPMRIGHAKMEPNQIGFMDLPGEIRNQIYDYAFPKGHDYEIIWLSRGKDLTHFRHRTPIQHKPQDLMFGKLRPHHAGFDGNFRRPSQDASEKIQYRRSVRITIAKKRAAYAQAVSAMKNASKASKNPTNSAEFNADQIVSQLNETYPWTLQVKGFTSLLGVSRQVHDEVASLFYSRNTFSFGSRTLMTKFLNNLTPIARSNLCKIYLTHDMLGVPFLRSDMMYREKEREKLVQDLRDMTSRCKSLTEFHLLMSIRGSYLQLNLTESWASDLVDGLVELNKLKEFQQFRLNLILADDTTNVSAVAAIRPRDDAKINRATQLVDAANLVRQEVLGKERFLAAEQSKGKKKANVLRIIA